MAINTAVFVLLTLTKIILFLKINWPY